MTSHDCQCCPTRVPGRCLMFGARAAAARGCDIRDVDLKDILMVAVKGAGPDKMEALGVSHLARPVSFARKQRLCISS